MELLSVRDLAKHFVVRGHMGGRRQVLRAVDGISFSIQEDTVMALVGESGCGKSTVARLVLRLINPTSGSVLFRGRDVFGFDARELKTFRKAAQIIFQDPFASLNPRRTVYDTVSEPLVIHKLVPRVEMKERVAGILATVGLGPEILHRYPHEFSGGQRQRICIARALAVSPDLIVADEPLSALDVSIQAQILNLLRELKRKLRISFLFISHDLRVVQYLSDTVSVMYLGKIVEHATTAELFRQPLHPYAEVLLASAPKIVLTGESGERRDAAAGRKSGQLMPRVPRAVVSGDVPSPISIPSGCPFHPRCPKRFDPCDRIVPELKGKDERLVSCHLWNPF
ncbi:MAG: ATP-binding cassette domain-containing protein [Nitrospirae bacterium]|nr:ATP-binding cassette domain-containing protein [Nitrospirota bacterium]